MYRRHMTSMQDFLIAMGIGSALIAFWMAARFPERGPSDMTRALTHVAIALAVGWFAPDLFNSLAAFGFTAALAAIFAILLPVLVYTFLAGAWFLKLMHDTFARYRH